MTILDEFGFRRAQGFARTQGFARVRGFTLEQAITIQAVSGDLRWALATLAARAFLALWARTKARLAALARHAAHGGREKVMTPSRCC